MKCTICGKEYSKEECDDPDICSVNCARKYAQNTREMLEGIRVSREGVYTPERRNEVRLEIIDGMLKDNPELRKKLYELYKDDICDDCAYRYAE